MVTEYKRDMYHNYLVIYDENSCMGDYYEKVLTYNEIKGHLKFECRMMDNKKYTYYEISGLQALSSVFEKHTILYTELKQIFNGIIQGVDSGKEYLLKENDYILNSNMIYFDISKFEVKICYFPGYDKSLREQLHELFEFFMNKVNYNDQAAVLLIYKLYMKSKDEACTIHELVDIINEIPSEDFSDDRSLVEKGERLHKSKKETDSGFEEPIISDNKCPNTIKKEGQGIHKKELIKEFSNDVNDSMNKIYHKLPFVSERVEEEREVLYYPISCYVICIISFLVCVVIYAIAYWKGYLFQEFGEKMDGIKNVAIIVVLSAGFVYVFIRVFDKNHRIDKIVPKINYIEPSLSTFGVSGSLEVEHHERNKEFITLQTREGNWNTEQLVNDTILDEAKTMMLTNLLKHTDVSLIPMNNVTYDTIHIDAFPFFVGKLKTHIDVQIPSPAISRFHAKITREEDEYFIVDLNSTNGTFVDGDMLESYKKRRIEHGNTIAFANVSYIFHCN